MDHGDITFKDSSASNPNNNKACKTKETSVFNYMWSQSLRGKLPMLYSSKFWSPGKIDWTFTKSHTLDFQN